MECAIAFFTDMDEVHEFANDYDSWLEDNGHERAFVKQCSPDEVFTMAKKSMEKFDYILAVAVGWNQVWRAVMFRDGTTVMDDGGQ